MVGVVKETHYLEFQDIVPPVEVGYKELVTNSAS